MSDLFIFAFGCVVTLFVVAAVFLLTWGAANETEGEKPVTSSQPEGVKPRPSMTNLEPAADRGTGAG